ncbi:hypothetical protein P280DRAFT_472520 [Massarina eburnea CBS 473.64]|uniref:Uncharacterized protein n=1 Tax=Massarina eburnea CBS 473.64 TaxID=1395130 RepID=A0A6A6RRH6_9PLEO|nr:hypothetical protein P280DRAFT_472520 [Massarina eburnea CBS 473.64]
MPFVQPSFASFKLSAAMCRRTRSMFSSVSPAPRRVNGSSSRIPFTLNGSQVSKRTPSDSNSRHPSNIRCTSWSKTPTSQGSSKGWLSPTLSFRVILRKICILGGKQRPQGFEVTTRAKQVHVAVFS